MQRFTYFMGRKHVTFYPGMTRLPEGSAPRTNNISHTITVDAEIPKGGAEGVLICLGGDTAGWTLFMKEGKLIYHYNWFDMERYEIVSKTAVPEGEVELQCEFMNETNILGGPATVRLLINGKEVAKGRVEKQPFGRFGIECLDVGMDNLSPVCKGYAHKLPFAFTGKIKKVQMDFEGPMAEMSPVEKLEMQARMD